MTPHAYNDSANMFQSYCTYEAYGEKGNNPKIDPIYPNPAPGGYKGMRAVPFRF